MKHVTDGNDRVGVEGFKVRCLIHGGSFCVSDRVASPVRVASL